jgi:GntR family transcriptional regulator/MocR family aminotransferase
VNDVPVNIVLDRATAVPLARQIETQVERLIRERLLAPGVKLPATRELARAIGVNRGTVALAYDELVSAGLARARVGQGTFVAGPATNGQKAPTAPVVPVRAPMNWSGLLSRSARLIDGDDERRHAQTVSRGKNGVISFAGGMPDSTLFPTDAFRRVLNRVVRDEGKALLQYYPAGGYPPLRSYLATYLLRFGVEARPEEILIVNGSQQGFDLIARTFIDPGDVVAMEQPTYPRAMQAFRSFGAQLLAVPWDGEGPRLDVFERLLERHAPKMFYCQPACHNPTGLTMTADRARQFVTMAARHQVPIVEDGFDASLYYARRTPPSLKALDRDGLVLYIGTFSNILFPGLRLGWLVAPPPVIERLERAKQLADLHTSALLQAAVHRFCDGKLLDRHAARAAREYARRHALLLSALRRRMPAGVTWTESEGGFSLLLTLPSDVDAGVLLSRALQRGVAFAPGEAFFVDGGGERTLRLSFSSVPASRIDEGIRRLAETIKETLRRRERRAVDRATVPLV